MELCAGAAVHETTASGEIICVIGDVDQYNIAELEGALESALGNSRPIIVDLMSCRYIGSVGLGVLLRAGRKAANLTVLVRVDSVVARFMRLAQVEQRLRVRHVGPPHSAWKQPGNISAANST